MTLYDISLPVYPGMVVWPGDPPVILERFQKIEDGARCNVSRLEAGTHIGTHVDAPFHFLANGPAVEQLSLEALIGPAEVVVFPDHVDMVSAELLEEAGIPPGTRRLLCKTRNSARWARGEREFDESFVALTVDAAEWVVERGISLIGVDYLSVARHLEPGGTTHKVLLGAGVVIVEGLDLSAVPSGSYTLVCLPLKLVGSDGAPARAILIQPE